ncbi:hypothetical protein TNCV_2503101 [Trichonephila clavipes]|nr:hypothetical protein TNCV_2503101 [Trichonephila clavipes]
MKCADSNYDNMSNRGFESRCYSRVVVQKGRNTLKPSRRKALRLARCGSLERRAPPQMSSHPFDRAPQYSVFPAGCSQRDAPEWTPGIKDSLYKTIVDCLPRNSSSRPSNVDAMCPGDSATHLEWIPKPGDHFQATEFPPLETSQLQACHWLYISRNHLNDYEKSFSQQSNVSFYAIFTELEVKFPYS